jgi:hypothetical protein
VADLQQLIFQDPGRSMRSMARELDLSISTVRKKMLQDNHYKSYFFRRDQFMNTAIKERKLARAKMVLKRKNNRWRCSDISEILIVMATKFPATVMVLGLVSNKGDLMLPHFFDKGLQINAEEYLKVLHVMVKPWMDRVAVGCLYVFQEDDASVHNSKMAWYWGVATLPELLSKELWPSSSPSCNPLDYYICSMFPHNTAASLMAKIMEMANLPRATMAKACKRFWPRIKAVVEAG